MQSRDSGFVISILKGHSLSISSTSKKGYDKKKLASIVRVGFELKGLVIFLRFS
jgi:hypothetical protein